MAFSNSNKVKIRKFLGFPTLFQFLNPRLENAIDTAGSDSDVQTQIESLIAKVEGVETKLNETAELTSGISNVDNGGVEFYKGQSIKDLKRIGRTYIGEISILMGTPPVNDYFGTLGFQDDFGFSDQFQKIGFFF